MYDVIVIGAGPAGLMASITAASRNKKVLLIDKNDHIGRKLEITGGGRCNLTNLKPVESFIKQIPVNSKTLYSTLTNFGPKEIVEYFSKLGVKLKVEDDDRVFPVSNKSATIIEALYNELIKYKVKLNLNETVEEIQILNDLKVIKTSRDTYQTQNIIIATGGFSYPHTGSSGDGYRFAKKTNQDVTNVYPAETFLNTKERYPIEGITLERASISLDNKNASGSLLFTHTGLSGPATIKISEEVYKKLQTQKTVSYIYQKNLPNSFNKLTKTFSTC
jgi:predicted Rossmann fold flavoprotein